MRKPTMLFVSAFALVMSATSLSAQSVSAGSAPTGTSAAAPARSGFFISGGLGAGSAGVTCDGCTTDRTNGLSGYLRLGGTVNPHLRLGFESNGWLKSENGVDEQVAFWSGAAYVYPSVRNNFWLKGGVGLATAKETDDSDELKADGLGVSVGAGYDWAVGGGSFVIVPYVGYLRQLSGKAKFDGSDTGVSANANLFQFGIGLGYRH
jgi:hypothetical protein